MMELIYTLKPTTLAEIEAIFTNKNVETATVQISAGQTLAPSPYVSFARGMQWCLLVGVGYAICKGSIRRCKVLGHGVLLRNTAVQSNMQCAVPTQRMVSRLCKEKKREKNKCGSDIGYDAKCAKKKKKKGRY